MYPEADNNRCPIRSPQLVDYTGRALREDKRGCIEAHFPPILARLEINKNEWLTLTTQFER